MRLFLDTNVLMEFIGHRAEYDNVRKILLTMTIGTLTCHDKKYLLLLLS